MSEIIYEDRRRSFLSCFYSAKEALPGLLAMFFIALFSNNLAGSPNPLTLENLFRWLDGVIGPVNHQPLFQILNSNFVWNSFLLGLIIGNVFGVPDSWKRGLSYIHKLMPLGIIMLAPHFVFSHAEKA
ncbi:MAG: putative sulfate exporter family transporter, partial [Mailhella sp.]|nr:putative sulfate exporter family transporter [Mailhella sp.]